MESTGRAGQIHVSEKTFSFLEDKYISEVGEEYEGHKTYYIIRRKSAKCYEHLRPNDLNLKIPKKNGEIPTGNAIKPLSQSATNLAVSPVLDSVSPSALSTGGPMPRNRSTTLNKLTRYLRSSVTTSGATTQTQTQTQTKDQQPAQRPPPPQIFISTKSLPESLTSTNPSILNCCPNSLTPISRHTSDRNASSSANDSIAVSPTNAATSDSSNRSIAANLRKYLKKFDNRNNNNGSVKCDKDKCVANDSATTDGNHQNVENDQTYQLLPIVIQKVNTETSLCTIEGVTQNGNGYDQNNDHPIGLSSSPSCSPRSVGNINSTDIIDVRSYISQSRSDITPFHQERADSCKYRSHRSYYNDVSPMRRPRAKTLALTSQEHLSSKMSVRNELKVPNALSPYGRKHSHHLAPISNHLQLPDIPANQTSISQERLSGDISSWVSNISDDPISVEQSSAIAIPSDVDQNLDPIRKQSDLQMIRCVRENARSQHSYLVQPPLSKFSLFFLSPIMETEFRMKAHQLFRRSVAPTITVPVYNTFIDIVIGFFVFTTVSVAMFLLSESETFQNTSIKWLWIVLFGLFSIFELFALFLFTKKLCRNPLKRRKSTNMSMSAPNQHEDTNGNAHASTPNIKNSQKSMSSATSMSSLSLNSMESSCDPKTHFEDKIISFISSWYNWHVSLGVLMSLPILLTLVHFTILSSTNEASLFGCYYGFLMLVCILHCCNFTQLNCWMRNILAVLAALAFIGGISMHQLKWQTPAQASNSNLTYMSQVNSNTTTLSPILISDHSSNLNQSESQLNASNYNDINYGDHHKWYCFEKNIDMEIYLDLMMVLILVWFLNREFEIFYRFAFYSSSVAEKDKIRVQSMKNQADLLLQNIIPRHVSDHLKSTAKYSENHHNVAIIFASLINFNELYDESYLGGREYLRVLNELIGDFDELLSRPEFSCVEKIKTIGSTFMAASGLDNTLRDDENHSHVNALLQFAVAMQEVVAEFNKDLLEFDLILRIGFNVGDVTAGVIGTSKLHYDIWGDAVNVSI